MRERIKLIMESEKMTPARFADSLHIGRAVISHILNGRNNPSLDVITRILTSIPRISSEWLLTGNGSMYKEIDSTEKSNHKKIDNILTSNGPDLFSVLSENDINNTTPLSKSKYDKENILSKTGKEQEITMSEYIRHKESSIKKIKQIIICYNDNTFETFGDR